MEVQERQFTPWIRASWDVLQNEVFSRVWHLNSSSIWKQKTVHSWKLNRKLLAVWIAPDHGLRILKSLARFFSSWSFVIRVNLLILNHPCSFMVYYYDSIQHSKKSYWKKKCNRRQGWRTDHDIDKRKNPKLKILSWLWLLRYSTRYFQFKISIFLFPSFGKRGSK